MKRQKKYLVINADDFGLSRAVNRGILECHTRGVVTSASLMVDRPGARQAAALARDHGSLAVGLHWDAGEDGNSIDLGSRQAVRRAFGRQLDRFHHLMGRLPTHVDSEAHVHRGLMTLFRELVAPLRVPLRGDGRVRFVGGFYAQWYPRVTNLRHVSVPTLQQLLREEVGAGWTELSCHPGYLASDYQSNYYREREAEIRTLTHPRVRRTIEQLGIHLVSYRDYHARGPE